MDCECFYHMVSFLFFCKFYPGIRFERYADDIIIHCRREQIAQSILQKLYNRFTECGLTIHPVKTQIICLDRSQPKGSERKVHTFEMGGYEFKPQWVKNGRRMETADTSVAIKGIKESDNG